MAGKKPAKVNSSNKKQEIVLPGKAIMYYGGKNAPAFTCPSCFKCLTKGIIYEHTDGKTYCSRYCLPKMETIV